jgi:hypothetical protein
LDFENTEEGLELDGDLSKVKTEQDDENMAVMPTSFMQEVFFYRRT